MLQFDVALCCIRDNVARKVRRYIHLFVASELVSDVLAFILARTHVASTNNKLIRLQRIPAFLPAASCGVSSGALLWRDTELPIKPNATCQPLFGVFS